MSQQSNNPSRGQSPAGGRGRGRVRGRGGAGGDGTPRGHGGSGSPISRTSSTGSGFARGGGQGSTPGGAYEGAGQPYRGRAGQPPRGGGGFRGGAPAAQVFAAGTPARVDQRLSTLDMLVTSFKRLPAQREMPFRPGFGTKGTPGVARANFFAFRIPKDLVIYDYKISIAAAPARAKLVAAVKARILVLLENHPEFAPHVPYIAHDRGERLVSKNLLPQPLNMTVAFYEEEEAAPRPNADVYKVEITFTRELNTNDVNQFTDGNPAYRNVDTLPLISALNLILQQHASRTGVRVGQNRFFFPSINESFPLSLGLEAKRGFFVSVRPMYKQLMVNINVCMTAFYLPGNLADAMLAFERESKGGMPREFADRLKIVTTYLGYPRKRTVTRIMSASPRQTRFKCDKYGGQITVEEFFMKEHKIRLQYADRLPVIDVGSKGKPTFLPPEICEILPNQAYGGTLPPMATAAMIKVACNPPHVNANSIVYEGIPRLGLQPNAPAGPLQGFGISVSDEMAVVPIRVLPPPRVAYKSGQPGVRDASWNILGVKFQAGGNMSNWAVLLVQEGRQGEFDGANDPELKKFLQTFSQKCESSGMMVSKGPPMIMVTPRLPPSHGDPSRNKAMTMIKNTLTSKLDQNKKPSFVLVLLSGEDNFIYPGIKRLGDVVLGLHTVHMLLRKARGDMKKQDQYFSNIALKVNVKPGGMNHHLDAQSMRWLTSKKTMMVGIDVTHPSPRSVKGTPSVAAVVASVDDHFVQFPCDLRPQRNRNIQKDAEEMVQDLTAMMVERLLLYQKRSKCLPDRVLVYRDGVSEGQYNLVLAKELPRILDAFKKFNLKQGTYRPTLSIMICGKRHHARPYVTDAQQMSRNGNTLPGTVIDKGITDVFNHDFYLQAHNGLQGQARPTHYVVIYDEHNLSADMIQEGTHNISYLYARATKGVSLIPAAYYADLACERARCYLNNLLNSDPEDKSVASSGTGKGKADQDAERERVYESALKLWSRGIHGDLKESMFYI